MAYCVRCGVKLESGATTCPLCQTEVIATREVVGKSTVPLFPGIAAGTKEEYLKVDKRRKGFSELVITFMAISIIILLITGFAIKDEHAFDPWMPIGCVLFGGGYLLVLLFCKISYPRLATFYTVLTMALLLFLDGYDFHFVWALYPVAALVVYWVVGVMPWILKRGRIVYGSIGGIISSALFLLVVDALEGGGLLWFFPIAFPTLAVVVVGFGLLALRLRLGDPTVTELILSVILIASVGVGSGDFFTMRTLHASQLFSWSTYVWIVALCLAVFLFAVATVKKVRLYFANKIRA
jgi:hypothetical protein